MEVVAKKYDDKNKRQTIGVHLEVCDLHDNTQRPDVARDVVFLGAEYLGRYVVGRVAWRDEAQVDLFGEAEIGQLDDGFVIVCRQ